MINLHTHSFLSGGGEMGQRIREYDWDNSTLGNPSTWSDALKATVRLLLSSGHAMFIWWGPNLIQFYNDQYRASIGPERHPVALGQEGKTCWAEIWPIIGPQIERVMRGEGSVWQENHLVPITRNNQLEDVYWTYSYDPIHEETAPNQVGGVLVVVAETTQMVQEQNKQKAAEARWRQLFDNAPSFMCMYTGLDHVYEYANTRYHDLFGRTDIVNRTLREVLPEVYEQGFGDLLDFIYESGNSHVGIATPVKFLTADGNERNVFLDFVLQPVRDSNNKITGIFANGYDVTARMLSQQSLEEQDRRKDEFLAMLAHELRNPLAPICNASELLTQINPQDSKNHSLGDLIKRQVIQSTRLIDDLLEVSRISQGKIELQMSSMSIDDAIKFAIESVSTLVSEKNLHLTYESTETGLHIDADYARLVQSITNILVNAIKYTEQNGNIHIRLYQSREDVCIDVSDTGIGIESHMLEKIFELFVQADQSIDRSWGGLGIGLSVVHTIIKLHGGTIEAHSSGIGQGSTFSIKLPLLHAQKNKIKAQKNIALAPLKFLLIDDNKDATDSFSMLLQMMGHSTEIAYKGRDGLALIAKEKFDVVLLDIGLPDIDGYNVAKHIRATHKDLIVVALSGYGQAEDIRKALEAGFSGHLTKPVSIEALENTIRHLLQQTSTVHELDLSE